MEQKYHFNLTRILVLLLITASSSLHLSAQNVADEYRALWAKANALYESVIGYKTERIEIDASQLSSNASDWQEGTNIGALVDNNPGTFWHSDWHNQVMETHYIQIDLEQPVSGYIALHVLRRQTPDHHATLMGCNASNDEANWDYLDEFDLDNATSGYPSDSKPISLGDKTYTHFRFYILNTTKNTIFSHFAEIALNKATITGEDRREDYKDILPALQKELEEGRYTPDWDLKEDMLYSLQSCYDKLKETMGLEEETNTELVDSYRKLWAEAKEACEQATGTRIGSEIPLSEDMLSSNASDYQEGRYLSYLVDRNPTSFWHSDWHNQVQEPHYIQIDLDAPIGGTIAFYAMRRRTANHHPTILGLSVSNDGEEWREMGDFHLSNATSGAETISNALSLGEEKYQMLRLTIKETSGGSIFGHFAEIGLYEAEILGEDRSMELGSILTNLQTQLQQGEDISDSRITESMLNNLKEAYETFKNEMDRLDAGLLPSYMTQKSDLPTLFINTYDGADITSKTVYKYAKMWRMEGDSLAAYDSLKIRGRGNSTWGMAKKPYRIKFANKEKFLGKGYAKAKNWTLMANFADKTLLRNAAAAFIGDQLGQPFVPAAEFADVVLNGRFLGNYQISDHIEVHKKRVEVVEQEDPATEESDITGGYLIEFNGGSASDNAQFSTSRGTRVDIKSPDTDIINWEQRNYIQQFVNDFEARVFSDNYADPDLGYRAVTDSATLISWFLGTEYTGNADGYYSVYAYKEQQDDHLRFGPMWDYDIAFNNCDRIGLVTERMMFDAGYSAGQMTNYVRRMYSDEWFRNAAGRAWHKAVKKDKLVEKTLAYVDSMALKIDQSQRLNFQIWPLSQHVYNEITLYSTYQEGVDYLKKFLVEHADYLSSQFPNPDNIDDNDDDNDDDNGDGDDDDNDDKALNPLDIAEGSLYYIYNVGVTKCVDIDANQGICVWDNNEDRYQSQMWQLIPVRGNYYRLVLNESNLAITDMADFDGNEYSRGAQLGLQEVDELNDRQLWEFVPTAGNYSIANAETGLAWNNSNGGADDGNTIISWTNNADNEWKTTRQWTISQVDPDFITDIASNGRADVDFRIAYDPISQQVLLHLPVGAEQKGDIFLHDLSGRLLGRGTASQPISVSHLAKGATYVVSWNVQGRRKSVKMSL